MSTSDGLLPAAEPCAPTSGLAPPPCYIITHSVSKRHNIGTIVRSATAFGVKEQCVQHLKEVEGCRVLGIEICEGASPVQQHPFTGPTAFLLGNEGQGLSERQMQLCDGFVYIPQYGPGTASLNVAVAASIVMHHFAVWASYPEREREGFKFKVAERPLRTMARGVVRESDDVVRQQREQRRAEALTEGDEAGAWGGGLFDDGEDDGDADAADGGGDTAAVAADGVNEGAGSGASGGSECGP